MNVEIVGADLRLESENQAFIVKIFGDAKVDIDQMVIWSAYGFGNPGTRIRIDSDVDLPWRGRIVIEAL